MSKTVIVLNKQTIYDIAVQEYGSVEGVIQIIKDNAGVNLQTGLATGQILKITAAPINKAVVNFLKDRTNPIHPVSGETNEITGSGGDYNDDENNDYN